MQGMCHGQVYGRREVPVQGGLPAELVQVCRDGMTRGGGSFGELYISIRYIIHHRYPFMVLLVRGSAESRSVDLSAWQLIVGFSAFWRLEEKVPISTSVRSPFLNLGNYTHCKPYTAPTTVLAITQPELLVCTLQE